MKALASLLSRLFYSLTGQTRLSLPVRQQHSVLKLFSIDLNTLPDPSFELYGESVNPAGRLVQRYFKALDFKELQLFDQVYVKHVNQSYSNITFVNNEPEKADLASLEKLINQLYRIYGEDEWGKGRFSSDDREEYLSDEAGIGSIRSWLDVERGYHRVLLGRSKSRLYLKICDVGLT